MSFTPTVYLCGIVISLLLSQILISVISFVMRFGIIAVSRKAVTRDPGLGTYAYIAQ